MGAFSEFRDKKPKKRKNETPSVEEYYISLARKTAVLRYACLILIVLLIVYSLSFSFLITTFNTEIYRHKGRCRCSEGHRAQLRRFIRKQGSALQGRPRGHKRFRAHHCRVGRQYPAPEQLFLRPSDNSRKRHKPFLLRYGEQGGADIQFLFAYQHRNI